MSGQQDSKKPKPGRLAFPAAAARGEYEAYCPHFPHCVGCPFIKVPYLEQLRRKREIVREALGHYPALGEIEVPPVTPSPRRLGYRARVKLVARRHRGRIAMGLYVPHSHRVIDITSCPVHPRQVNQVAHYLKRKLTELGIVPYDERDDSGELRYVDFRFSAARNEVSVTLVTRHAAFQQGGKLARALQERFPFVSGVIQNINESRGNVIWGDRYRTLGGRDTIMERLGDLKLVYPPGVFTQANPFTARKIYETVAELAALTGKETVLDLYCGVGPVALQLAAAAKLVWAVDENELAVAAAKQNARRNGRGNCHFVAGDVAAGVERLRRELAAIDLIVVNPPRRGVQPQAMEALLAAGAPRIIYVSCAPLSLARDLDKLSAAGFRVDRLQPFDMFPQTEEVESVVSLARRG